MHVCIFSGGSAVEPALTLACLPLCSPLTRSPLWQMARGDVKSEQAERGGMSVVALRFVSCYLPLAATRWLHAWLVTQERLRLRCCKSNTVGRAEVTHLTLTTSDKLVKSILVNFMPGADGCALWEAVLFMRSRWQKPIISVRVSLSSTGGGLFSLLLLQCMGGL